jgi:hypothetical protein
MHRGIEGKPKQQLKGTFSSEQIWMEIIIFFLNG